MSKPDITFATARPSELVDQWASRSTERQRNLDIVFAWVPGAAEFVHSFADYVQLLPRVDGDSSPLLHGALTDAISQLSVLGLSPITLQAHRRGFTTLVRSLVSHVDPLAGLSVTASGKSWNPFFSPLGSFAPRGTQVEAVFVDGSVSAASLGLLRIFMLSRCLSFGQLCCIAETWPTLTSPQGC